MAKGRLRRWVDQLFYGEAPLQALPCPLCGRELRLYPVTFGAEGGAFYLQRPPQEVLAACRDQHGTSHTLEELRAHEAAHWDEHDHTARQELERLEERIRRMSEDKRVD